MAELKGRHRTYMGVEANEIMDSDDETVFSWLKWLNPQSRRAYVRAREAAQDAAQHNGTHKDEDGAEAVAIASCGQPEVGDFNYPSE